MDTYPCNGFSLLSKTMDIVADVKSTDLPYLAFEYLLLSTGIQVCKYKLINVMLFQGCTTVILYFQEVQKGF